VAYLCAKGIKNYPVDLICKVLGIGRSTYYERKKRPLSERESSKEYLADEAERLFKENKREYGRRRLWRAMRNAGYKIGQWQVRELMKMRKLVPKGRKKYKATTNSKHNNPVAPNLLKQNFAAEKPNEKWCGDSTYIATEEGWLYAAGIIDLCDRSCVGLSFGRLHTQELMLKALDNAKRKHRPAAGLMFHSDQGVQYASLAYRQRLKKYGMVQSMSRTGNPYDNAPMESFWATVKKAVVQGVRFRTRNEAMQAIFEYVFGFYNTHRMHSLIGYQAPMAYRKALLLTA
jgi:transposase InsO family protein